MKKNIYSLIVITSFVFFVFFGYQIYNYKYDEKIQKELTDSIVRTSVKNIESEFVQSKRIPICVDFKSLKEKNSDIIAWIYSEGTPINYPIVQSKDNDYYLRRLIDGSYNQIGTIFLDCNNSSNFNDFNSIIYGHNMKNDSMFGTLLNYKNQEYYENHKEMFLITENKKYKIELFAGFLSSSESDIYMFPKTTRTNEKLVSTAIKSSTFKSDVNVAKEDKIITFSTCSYEFEDARYILLGVLRKV